MTWREGWDVCELEVFEAATSWDCEAESMLDEDRLRGWVELDSEGRLSLGPLTEVAVTCNYCCGATFCAAILTNELVTNEGGYTVTPPVFVLLDELSPLFMYTLFWSL